MSEISYKNLDACAAFDTLRPFVKTKRIRLKDVLTAERVARYSMSAGGGLTFNYAARPVDDEILAALATLAKEQQAIAKYRILAGGEIMNTGEKRRVLHHLCRGQLGAAVVADGRDLGAFYRTQKEKWSDFATRVHSGEIRGSTGKPFRRVVQIGIGGSDLGPRALYLALLNAVYGSGRDPRLLADFISNVDPDDAADVVRRLNLEETLFVLVSKSGTTQETLTNELLVKSVFAESGIPGLDVRKHMTAVTSETSPLAKNADYLASFFIDDNIGGRYSSTSAVGGVVLTLAFGKEVFEEFLEGAHDADGNALNEDPAKNAALTDALIGLFERNVLGYPSTAILPYSQALSRFPAHLQQLDMESNGKQVNRRGEPVTYATGPVIFGEPGTNGQHSFFQLLHQGTDVVPLQFIGFLKPQTHIDRELLGSTSQKKLNANLAAQIAAFALGKEDVVPNKNFPGGRPSSLLSAHQLTPRVLGALLAHFENKVMFQGFLWNINSFDQEGVQLGKVLTQQVLGGKELHPALAAYAKTLGAL